jgi:hypothetical protein
MVITIMKLRSLVNGVTNPALKAAVEDGVKVLVKYYIKACHSVPVVMATITDPRFKADFFNWALHHNISGQDEEIREAVTKMAMNKFSEYHARRTGGEKAEPKMVSTPEKQS